MVFFGSILFSPFVLMIIIAFSLRLDIVQTVRTLYRKNPNYTVNFIARESGAAEEVVMYIISRMERKKEKLLSNSGVVISSSKTQEQTPVFFNLVSDIKMVEGKELLVDKRLKLVKNGNQLVLEWDRRPSKSETWIIVIFLIIITYLTLLMFFLPLFDDSGYLNILILICWLLMFLLDGIILYASIYSLRLRNRINEFQWDKQKKMFIIGTISPKKEIKRTISFSEINFFDITSTSSGSGLSFHVRVRLQEGKGVKLCETREFSKCFELARYLSNFSEIGVVSKKHGRFLNLINDE